MAITVKKTIGALLIPAPKITLDLWRHYTRLRLNAAYEAAVELPFDDSSRYIFFSDCHRGDNSRADAFAPNKPLFLHALTHYFREGFTYVEVGDGDEMWKNRRMDDIIRSHPRVFDLLHRFSREGRLHIIVGNHDIGSRKQPTDKDGITLEEGLILRHRDSGQRLFVVHGHQADFKTGNMAVVSRAAVRHVWRRLQLLGFGVAGQMPQIPPEPAWRDASMLPTGLLPRMQHALTGHFRRSLKQTERRIIEWVDSRRLPVICGHTHRPRSPSYGEPPYFNTGSCVDPGVITGFELRHGTLTLVRWFVEPSTNENGPARVLRQILAPPKRLHLFTRGHGTGAI
jgi:UDP-2,3-diacylglucosamine pyrophosphatase LpxH